MKYESPTWIRKGHRLIPANPVQAAAEGLKQQNFGSISAAKRQSAILQKANGGLGCGFVKVQKGK